MNCGSFDYTSESESELKYVVVITAGFYTTGWARI